MTNRSAKQYHHFLLLFLLPFLMFACNVTEPGVEQTPEVTAQILVFPSGSEERLISEERIPQDNCDGTAEMSQTLSREHAVLYTMELGAGLTVSADGKAGVPGVGQVGVGTEVATYYRVGYGRQEAMSRSQTVSAAPRSHMQHTIQHFEIWETGEVLVITGNHQERLPYGFRRDFSIKVAASANIGCPLDGNGEALGTPQETTTTPTTQPPGATVGPLSTSCFLSDWEACWAIDDNNRTLTWVGPQDSSFDIGQKGAVLEKIRAGYTAVFTIQSPGRITTCVGTINGQPFTGECPIVYVIQAGTYEIVSPGASGGFRVERPYQ